MLRNDAYWFLRLGGAIERADNTARILDVKYHVLLPERESVGGGLDYFLHTVFNYPTLAECYKVAALDASNKLRY